MSTHSVADARNHLSRLIDRAIDGETVVITRHGAVVAELKAAEPRGRPMTPKDIEWIRSRRVGKIAALDAGQFVSQMRDEDEQRLLRR